MDFNSVSSRGYDPELYSAIQQSLEEEEKRQANKAQEEAEFLKALQDSEKLYQDEQKARNLQKTSNPKTSDIQEGKQASYPKEIYQDEVTQELKKRKITPAASKEKTAAQYPTKKTKRVRFADPIASYREFSLSKEPVQKSTSLPSNNHSLLRDYPPVGMCDTINLKRSNKGETIIESVYPDGNFIKDEEIIRVIQRRVEPSEGSRDSDKVVYSPENNKAIIQQQGRRGCTAACSAMLIADNGKENLIDWYTVRFRNLGNTKDIVADIEKAGLLAIETKLPYVKPTDEKGKTDLLEQMRALILQNSSMIVHCDTPDIGGHVMIVDSVSEDLSTAIVRDPLHGWQIEIYGASLYQVLTPVGNVRFLQVDQKNRSCS